MCEAAMNAEQLTALLFAMCMGKTAMIILGQIIDARNAHPDDDKPKATA